MSGIAALAYADVRSAVNAFRDIRRSAARSTLWIAGLLLFLSWFALRAAQTGRPHRAGLGPLVQCDVIAAFVLVVFGLALAHGSRLVGLFATRAEGQWIVRAPISPFAATIYIQLRELLRRSPRLLISFGYLAVVYLPNVVPPTVFMRDLGFFVLALLAIGTVPLPRRLARGPFPAACIAAGYACIAFAVLPLVHDFTGALPAWHPGIVLLEPWGARSAAVLAALAAIAATAILALGASAGDTYPELYAISVEHIDRSSRIGRNPFARRARPLRTPRAETPAGRVPPGVAVFVWKAWIEYVRRTSPRIALLQAAGCFAAGYVLALLVGPGRIVAWYTIATILFSLLLAVSVGYGVSIGAELRRPLFWLSGARLFVRLCALLAGTTLRYCAWFVLGGLGIAAGRAAPIGIALAAVAAPATLLLMGAIGYAAYALIPNEIDRRGPFAALRILISYLCALPVAIAGIAAGILARAALAGIAVAAVGALAEAALLLALAAWRLSP